MTVHPVMTVVVVVVRLVPLPSKALIAEAQMSAHSALRNIDRGSPSEAGFVVRHFCRTYTPHPPAPGNVPVHCYTGSLFTHHYPQGISLRLSTSGQEAGYSVALTSSIRLAMVVSEIRCLGPRVTTTPPPCNVRCGKIPIVQREIYIPA